MKIADKKMELNVMNSWKEKWKVKIDPGILGPYLERFVEELFTAGYTKLTIGGYVGTGAHLGFWLTHNDITLEKVDEDVISTFAEHHCDCPFVPNRKGVSQQYIRRVRRIVDFLERQGVVQQTQVSQVTEAPLLRDFRHWLSAHRGLSEYTVKRVVRLTDKLCLELGYDSKNYTSEKIRNTVCAYADSNSRGQVKCFTTALRTFIKFLVSQGLLRTELLASIPVIPQWRLSSLPKYLHEADVKKIIASCDTNRPNGVRDRAILLLLSRLALRAGDIVAMRLQDVVWDKGTIKLSGKGRMECHLPLPQEVGECPPSQVHLSRFEDGVKLSP